MNGLKEWILRAVFLGAGVGAGWLLFSSAEHGTATNRSPSPRAAAAFSAAPPGVASAGGQAKTEASAGSLSVSERVAARFEAGMRNPSQRQRLASFLAALETLTPEEAPELLALISRLDREGLQFPLEWSFFIRRWGEVDGPAAAAHALSRGGERWAQSGLRDIFAGWGAKDPAAAAHWLNEHGDSPLFDAALTGLVGGLAEKDPAAATRAAIDSLPPDNRRAADMSMELLAEAVVRKGNTAGLLDWYASLPDTGGQDGLRNSAFGHVWWRLKHADINQAAQWLAAEADKPWRSDQQYRETAEIMAAKDPAAALDWAGSLPPSPANGRWPGVSSVFREWMAGDPAAASAWLNARPNDAFGDYVRNAAAAPGSPPATP